MEKELLILDWVEGVSDNVGAENFSPKEMIMNGSMSYPVHVT